MINADTFHTIGICFLIYFAIVNGVYALLLLFSLRPIFFRAKVSTVEDATYTLKSNTLPEITFLVPAYNESKKIVENVQALLDLSYYAKQIIVINDGSSDDTLAVLQDTFDLEKVDFSFTQIIETRPVKNVYKSKVYKRLTVIDKKRGFRYDALNAGINACQDSYFITVDADTVVDDEYFTKILRPLLEDENTVAIGANVRILNGCTFSHHQISTDEFPKDYPSSMQSIEYLRTFQMRAGWDYLGGNFVISGAFGFFNTQLVKKIGGFGPTFANDMEIVVRLKRVLKNTPYTMSYIPHPVAWTEGPETLKELGYQRRLWHRGLLDTLFYHKSMLFNPKYGAFGYIVYPFMLFGEALEPFVELAAYVFIFTGLGLGYISWSFVLLFLCITWFLTTIYSLLCLCVEVFTYRKYRSFKTIAYLTLFSFIEMFGYRQMTIFWRIAGAYDFFKELKIVREHSKKVNAKIKPIEKEKGGLGL